MENCPDLPAGTVELREAKLEGDSLSAWLYNTTPEVVPMIICAAYDQNGKMLDVQVELVQEEHTKEPRTSQVCFVWSQQTEAVLYYRLFVVEYSSMQLLAEVETVFAEDRA